MGPYTVLGPLGRGGMGEVYRARDARLDREVAIKVLPSHLAIDPDLRARFEAEAKAIGALSHPNILAIHDVGVDHGVAYAVVELLDGETLRERLSGAHTDGAAPMPLRNALDLAIQIGRGLSAAHDKGIVHRDLKPENIFISPDGRVKILDFGLARLIDRSDDESATGLRRTDPGTVMGTVGYMAPEQVKGLPADQRADIFSFGCVLYEMVTGRRAFQRNTPAETMTAILREDLPDAVHGGSELPPAVDPIVRHCLEKQPGERYQSVRDLTFALQSLAGSGSGRVVIPAPARGTSRRLLAWTAITVLVAAVTGAGVWWAVHAPATPAQPTIRATLPLADLELPWLVGKDDNNLALSPAGDSVVYVNTDRSRIVLRNLESGTSRTIVEGGEVGQPFFSPDGRFVGFVQGGGGTIRTAIWGAIRKVAISGGAPSTVADGIVGLKGAVWGDDGWIYYSPAPAAGLWRARADGSAAPEKLTDPDTAHGEKTHRLPFVLPGSQAVLFVVGTSRITSFDEGRIEVLRLSDRSRHRLVEGGTAPGYIATGHLLYERGGQLLAIPFDPDHLAVHGAPVTVMEGVANLAQSGISYHQVSAGGTLAFTPQTGPLNAEIIAMDRRGTSVKLADASFGITSGSVSPRGTRLALDPDGATQQIEIVDLARNSTQRFTYEWDNSNPLWTPDGARLIFRSDAGGGTRRLFWQAADGSGAPEQLLETDHDALPTSVHGKLLLYEMLDSKNGNDLWITSLDDRKPHELVRTPFDETGARFSPDGRWIAYQSNVSGSWEVYVQRYPASGGRQQVSQGGGIRAAWPPDGRSLFYMRGTTLMSVQITDAGPGTPAELFQLQPTDMLLDVMPDGRFLAMRRHLPATPSSLTLVVNWFEAVRRIAGR